MLINFQDIPERTISGMNGGTGEIAARLYMGAGMKIIPCRIRAGGSIGMHGHPASDDINYVLGGKEKAICGGQEEVLEPGVCHICPMGLEHSIVNTGAEDLVLLTVVIER